MTGDDVRQSFLDFFRARGHEIVPSASLVPAGDPTLLFTNAGMVQFKQVFLGAETRHNPRAADSQKCLRISGKHNDLEEVGRDTYHHTFFEMLGNWSFGDYYKREAIAWAWELLTALWKLPKDELWATVFTTDDEAVECWRTLTDIGPERILRFDEKENFWEMGETGPCGPCSEIHVDRGPEACDRRDVAGHACAVNGGCARYIELWNLVFIQYNRDERGELHELPQKHVDTGMGLERVTAVLQGVPGNYDADLLRDIIRFTEGLCAERYGGGGETDVAFRVIADHGRAIAFTIADGVRPSNEGRGYVLRRILRRAARYGKNLGIETPFLSRVAGCVIERFGAAYPELRRHRDEIEEVVRAEEVRFGETLSRGGEILEEQAERLRRARRRVLPGDVAFKLYDTYGFPLDLTEDVLKADGIEVDRAGFEQAMAEQRARAREAQRAASSSGGEGVPQLRASGAAASRFAGDFVYRQESEVTAVFVGGAEVDEAREGSEAAVVVAETPFYAESGGQIGDRGRIETEPGDRFEVADTRKEAVRWEGGEAETIVHLGRVARGVIRRGSRVRLTIDRARRDAARLNHSVTHILHAVLRGRLGHQVRQAGSLVAPERLRFDFTFQGPLAPARLVEIENEVNAHIRENAVVTSEEMAYDEAIRRGALAFFGDKYGERVRVVRMGDFSTELCGGTHVRRTGDIGLFKLRGESGVAAGVRRIEALTGEGALDLVRKRELLLREIGEILKGPEEATVERLERLLQQQKDVERRMQELQSRLAGSQSADLVSRARRVNGVSVLTARVDDVDDRGLREMADRLREKLGSGIVVLGTARGDKALLLAAVTKDLVGRYAAGQIIKQIAPLVGGGGGGKPEMAQAGGPDASRIDEALARVYEVLT
ncbi:MAG: alanine--tRNA ligase [Deltaproteobacteria bacterium]|nr:alanine--tRNA ligase [Deltaproteobacteria bacterium]